jgi:preprotein translocase subunit SecE
MSNNRIVMIGYVVLALVTGIFLEHCLLALFNLFSLTQPLTAHFSPDSDYNWCTVIGLGLSYGAAFWIWRTPRYHQVSLEIVSELRKVSWPSFAETRAATVAVIVASLIAAVLLGLFDVAWQFVTDKIQNPTL